MKQQKFIATIFSSIVLSMVFVKMFEGMAHRLNPSLSTLDRNDMNSIFEYWSNLPTVSIVFMLIAHFAGMAFLVLMASYMSKQLIVEKKDLAIKISAAVVMIYVVMSLIRLPHPMIMNIADPIVTVLGYFAGKKLVDIWIS